MPLHAALLLFVLSPAILPGGLDVTKPLQRLTARFFTRQALGRECVDPQVEMGAQLVVDFRGDVVGPPPEKGEWLASLFHRSPAPRRIASSARA